MKKPAKPAKAGKKGTNPFSGSRARPKNEGGEGKSGLAYSMDGLSKVHAKNRKRDPRSFAGDWTVNEGVISEYLTLRNGMVSDTELEAATYFEYARANTDLLFAAAKYRGLNPSDRRHAVPILCADSSFPTWVIQWPWLAIWQCKPFPPKHWIELGPRQREPILWHLRNPDPESRPLECQDIRHLDAQGILKQFQELAQKASAEWVFTERAQKVCEARLLGQRGTEHIIFTINWRESPKVMLGRLGTFLDSNKGLSDTWRDDKRGRNKGLGQFKTALRDLYATWIFKTKGIENAIVWTERNRLKDRFGKSQNYFDSTRKDGPLYNDESQWRKAKRRAADYFWELFPACKEIVDEDDRAAQTFEKELAALRSKRSKD